MTCQGTLSVNGLAPFWYPICKKSSGYRKRDQIWNWQYGAHNHLTLTTVTTCFCRVVQISYFRDCTQPIILSFADCPGHCSKQDSRMAAVWPTYVSGERYESWWSDHLQGGGMVYVTTPHRCYREWEWSQNYNNAHKVDYKPGQGGWPEVCFS